MMLNVALIGCGGISGAHIPRWEKIEGVNLVAICDIRPERLQKWKEKYGELHTYTDYTEMMEQEKIDILDICLPTYLHCEYAIDAMNRGKHVLCEKPAALEIEDAKKMFEASRRNQVKFMIAQVLRFWGEYVYLKDMVESGKYGKLLCARMHRVGTYPRGSYQNWMLDEKLSKLVPYDLHIHDLDFLIDTFGRPQSAQIFRAQDGVADVVHYVYRYPGFFISADASWYRQNVPFKAGYCFVFEHATAVYEGALTIYTDDGEVLTPKFGGNPSEEEVMGLPVSDGYLNEIQYFFDCVRNDQPVEKVTEQGILDVLEFLNQQAEQ